MCAARGELFTSSGVFILCHSKIIGKSSIIQFHYAMSNNILFRNTVTYHKSFFFYCLGDFVPIGSWSKLQDDSLLSDGMLSLNTNKIRYHGSGVFSNGDDEMFENFEETENALHPDQNELTGKTLDEKEVLIIETILVKYD